MEESTDLRDYLSIIGKRKWMVISITTLVTLLTAAVSLYLIPPVYEAKTDLLVNRTHTDGQTFLLPLSEIESNLKLIETYSVIIQSTRIREIVNQKLGLNMTEEIWLKQVKVENLKNSQVVSIRVVHHDQQLAVNLSNQIANTFQEEVVSLLNVNNVHILSEAKLDPQAIPVQPKPLVYSILGLIASGAFSIGLGFLLEFFNTRLRSEKDIEKYLGVTLLGTIGTIDTKTARLAEKHS